MLGRAEQGFVFVMAIRVLNVPRHNCAMTNLSMTAVHGAIVSSNSYYKGESARKILVGLTDSPTLSR